MLTAEYALMRAVEDRHWWYLALRRLVLDELRRQRTPGEPLIVDVGCGTGGSLRTLRQAYPRARLVGLDPEADAVALARSGGAAGLARARAEKLCLAPGSVDAVLCLDVLNHEGVDAEAALREISGALKPGGVLLVNVPAFAALRGRHDAAVQNVRRFTRAELLGLLRAAGLEPVFWTYWNAWLAPLAWGWRFATRALPGPPRSDLALPPAAVNAALGLLARAELAVARLVSLPLGVSFFAVARRQGGRPGAG